MINHVWSVVCQSSSIDVASNLISVYNVIDEIRVDVANAPPAGGQLVIPMRLEVVNLWIRDNAAVPEVGRGRITLIDPTGTALGAAPHQFDIDLQQHERSRTRTTLPGIPVTGNGRHTIVIDLEDGQAGTWTRMAAIPITVEIRVI